MTPPTNPTHDSPEIETWRPIPGYEGEYEISDHGNARSLDRSVRCGAGYWKRKGQPLRLTRCGRGYLKFRTSKESQRVHRVVAMVFIGPPERPDDDINHINGDKADNRAVNLEWCDRKQNCIHAAQEGLSKTSLTPMAVRVVRRLIEMGMYQKHIGEVFSVGQSAISDVKRGRRWSHVSSSAIRAELEGGGA